MTELVKVSIGKGVFMRMEKQEAIEKGLYKEPAKKQAKPAQNKMVMPAENKAPVERDDLTEIVGIGKATASALHGLGIYTFDDLADVDVETLPTSARAAVKRYQEGL